ncbi:CIA30 family protein [Puniceibacterium antarcticum]|nr:CIA30 family protein [Puniceibacterium antarcticum]
MKLSPVWEYIADGVMGGISKGQLKPQNLNGRNAMRLTGQVSLDNNGGFVQMAFDLRPDGCAFDASTWSGIELDVLGNSETYDLRLRTDQLNRPWQSFRTDFTAPSNWITRRVAFADMQPHRTEQRFNPAHLRRIGVLGIGREFAADVAVSAVRLYRD